MRRRAGWWPAAPIRPGPWLSLRRASACAAVTPRRVSARRSIASCNCPARCRAPSGASMRRPSSPSHAVAQNTASSIPRWNRPGVTARPLRSSSVSSEPPSSSTCTDCVAGVETPRNPDATPVIELVGQRQTVPAPCPGLETGPVAALDGPSLAAGVDAVERRAHCAQQSRLACLVPAGDDRHARMQLFGQVVQASEAGDVQALEDHRNPISAPESAIRP